MTMIKNQNSEDCVIITIYLFKIYIFALLQFHERISDFINDEDCAQEEDEEEQLSVRKYV